MRPFRRFRLLTGNGKTGGKNFSSAKKAVLVDVEAPAFILAFPPFPEESRVFSSDGIHVHIPRSQLSSVPVAHFPLKSGIIPKGRSVIAGEGMAQYVLRPRVVFVPARPYAHLSPFPFPAFRANEGIRRNAPE